MKNIRISFLIILACGVQTLKAQNTTLKKDTVYYFLNTLSIPEKDRLFEVQAEANILAYVLKCKCYPWETDPVFISKIDNRKNVSKISIEEFKKLKLISVSDLITLAAKYGKDRVDRTHFYFIEPNGALLTIRTVNLMPPRKPSQGSTINSEVIKPSKH